MTSNERQSNSKLYSFYQLKFLFRLQFILRSLRLSIFLKIFGAYAYNMHSRFLACACAVSYQL